MLLLLQSIILSFVLYSGTPASQAMHESTVETSLSTVRTWLQANAAPLVKQLNPPASADEIDRFETQSGVTLPNSVRAAYAVHNGESQSSQGIFGTWRWLPLDEVRASRQQLLETGLDLATGAIPILVSGGGDYHYVESVGTGSGESEVFEWWHEQPEREVEYANFATLLAEFAAQLEQGRYVYMPDELVGLIDRDDLQVP